MRFTWRPIFELLSDTVDQFFVTVVSCFFMPFLKLKAKVASLGVRVTGLTPATVAVFLMEVNNKNGCQLTSPGGGS